MKKIVLALGAATLIFAACQDAPKADNTEATDAQTVDSAAAGGAVYNADLTQSTVQWTGTKPIAKHVGTIAMKSGSLNVTDGNITGGKFVLDINTINPQDQDSTGNGKLKGHLLSPDFFDAATHPEASFEITNVTAGIDTTNKDLVMKDATHTVTGNLTIKGTSKSISFPAKLSVTDANVTADANFNIDRTQWGLTYGNDKSLGDKFISPTINFVLHLVANK
ncbi:MAG TPA: YceI family protein [Flavipsychrobacter sp.]|nr:YceI family protein [Flavipsychrobacter sp.]